MPEDATPQQKAEFEAGEGGALVPVASVDKSPEQIAAVDQTLEAMVSVVKAGQVGSFVPFDTSGAVLALGG